MEDAQLLGGRYALLDQLGSGGMAVVWRARDEVLARTVAVKVLAGRHAGEPDARDRIRAEARATAKLSHPNIAQVYDYGEAREDGAPIPYVVMELVRGSTLQHRMDSGPMSPRFAMRVAAEVAAALAAAHSDGLVHRDIKPANVMLAETGAKVVDFGIAAAINPAGTGDEEFEVLGTPAYLAPERLIGDGVEPASDVYALGVLLYRMVSGQSPWSADTTTQMLSAHIYVDPEPLPPRPGVPDYVTLLCNRCLSKDTTERPSAREAAALLAQGAGLRVVEDALPTDPEGGPSHDNEPSVLIRPRGVRRLPGPRWYDDPAPAGPAAAAPAGPAAAAAAASAALAGPGAGGSPAGPGAGGSPAGPGAEGSQAAPAAAGSPAVLPVVRPAAFDPSHGAGENAPGGRAAADSMASPDLDPALGQAGAVPGQAGSGRFGSASGQAGSGLAGSASGPGRFGSTPRQAGSDRFGSASGRDPSASGRSGSAQDAATTGTSGPAVFAAGMASGAGSTSASGPADADASALAPRAAGHRAPAPGSAGTSGPHAGGSGPHAGGSGPHAGTTGLHAGDSDLAGAAASTPSRAGAASASGPGASSGPGADSGPGAAAGWGGAAGPGGAAVAGSAGKRRRPRRRAVPVLAAVLLLALAGLLWWLIGSGDDGRTGQTVVAPGASGGLGTADRSAGADPTDGATSLPARAQTPGATATTGLPVQGDRPPAAGAPGAPGVTATTTPPPDAEEPEPTTTAPTTDPPAEERTFTSSAGSVRATCPSSSTAELLSWSATKPYKVNDVEEGPASSAAVVFKHGNELVRMTVTCSGGVPSGDTSEG
ncbi:protein kinase [Actinoplanes sp. NPDC049599]|uniref:protein kinase domain-containing protein n=1 Tax=Actinoplanes sp. NPDC049599 TaxID=3363903 RepID=UPI0037BD5B5D